MCDFLGRVLCAALAGVAGDGPVSYTHLDVYKRQEWVEANFVVEKDIEKLGDRMIESIEAKRKALGI